MRRCGVWLILLLLVFELSACTPTPKQVCPDDGVWYCEELPAQFYMDWEDDFSDDEFPVVDETETYIIVNGDRIAAGCGTDRVLRNEVVVIFCVELNHPVYDFGETIYSMEFVQLTDTEYVIKDDEGKHYTFIRIGDSPADIRTGDGSVVPEADE